MNDLRSSLTLGLEFWRTHMVALTEDQPQLRPHLNTVGRRCRELAQQLRLSPSEVDMATAAGLTHDLGKVPRLARIGWHPLDGANYIYRQGEGRLANLVARHTGAFYEAMLLGHDRELERFPQDKSLVADILTVCDMTTKPDGSVVSADERRADLEARYGRTSIPVRALAAFWPEYEEAAERIRWRQQNLPRRR